MESLQSNLIATVQYLSQDIGERSYLDVKKLTMVADFIEERFRACGCSVKRQPFSYGSGIYHNVIGEISSSHDAKDGILVIGAHYDTVVGTPGADDNASGIAGLLELARLTALSPHRRTVRFVAFSLEEPPVFMTSRMGSHVYARSLKDEGIPVFGMISLEMLGYYCDVNDCQYYPLSIFRWFYPEKGNYIAFVGNIASRSFTNKLKRSFASVSSLPLESLNGVSVIPGVDFSDHRSFWKFGFPAFMITDTAFYRNPNYHGPGDTPDTLDYQRMAELVAGLHKALGTV
ncbi:MAG: M28 family peptidase [Thermodesulfovibrionales bacterium]|jgi:Zn-dependent M28 family amino/carboxypeptidase